VIEVYRLNSSRHPANSGKGAAITGGRWNRRGTEIIYTAASRSLAVLEIMANYAVLPKDFVLTPIRIPDHVGILAVPDSRSTDRLEPADPNSSHERSGCAFR
jgi:RES domain-containing protein